MLEKGVKFTLSDDSHGVAQVGYGYHDVLAFAKEAGIEEVYYYDWKGCERSIEDGKVVEDGIVAIPAVGNVVLRKISIDDWERWAKKSIQPVVTT